MTLQVKKPRDKSNNFYKKVVDLKLLAYGISDKGKVRDHNEDAFVLDDSKGIYLVADGVGGQNAGEIASMIIAQVLPLMLSQKIAENLDDTSDRIEAIVKEVLEDLSQQIRNHSKINQALEGMASTVVFVIVRSQGVYVAHAGDSRAYLFRNGTMAQITTDHSLVAKLIEIGKITKEEARNHPAKHIVTSVLGQEEQLDTEIFFFKPQDGDYLLLCSDGLSDMVSDERICDIILKEKNVEELCSTLVTTALKSGGIDNITVILIRWHKDSE